MATLPTATRNALANAVDDLVNAGAGTAVLEVYTSAFGTLLASFDLANPAFGAASTGVITLQSTPISTTADDTGTAAKYRLKDRDGTTVLEGDIGAEFSLDNTSIASGQTVRVTAGTITMPAS